MQVLRVNGVGRPPFDVRSPDGKHKARGFLAGLPGFPVGPSIGCARKVRNRADSPWSTELV